ncbi:helix-turn-helix domain-containing protein [Paenibacillus sacheonensis]|uniref:Helix-turn-helix domain-containing protein n=1 Tax=Paenibacillus sacheonensis TaxID=742054 RepID=A0A7X4YVD8_9BACL|nr:helix-turn-helix transcriptional regulator [Paenibacillus sacheonensis]MBM7565765.1 transcriptional regulator with XRE-family HTH domain [Paenibacillus sacheonensis]NBC72179.1 helix-turn-helix domain-containing protein [Paenibacillus sacheonensis]
MELRMSLRRSYQTLRKMNNLKLRQVANRIGISVPMLSMYENEIVNLSKEKEIIYREMIMTHKE